MSVTVRELTAGYRKRAVLHRVSARMPGGAVTAVVGPNGSGKSTLLGVLAGVLAPMAGTVELPGGDRPGLVLQRSAVPDSLPITVRETVAMGRWGRRGPWRRLTAADRDVVEECLARLGLTGLAGLPLATLSGGQRQRALIAQGLAQEPGVLLLDEPVTGLDEASRGEVEGLMAEIAAHGVTVVHATHDPDAVSRADHCLLLSEGRLIAEGPPSAVVPARL
ncbi:zinc ABC transporter ATP-binding protein AztA [Nonomuraea soli]|uniref:Zinc/manganese transport system ATP-binding protein n=1 Tax=Nonomuraea soli TaxID=1032476 RepID=A0A7W0CGY0_9ACTN|nr:zinc ABC transporter ATP-binding protein AztA [Nonomuraea soli]MBA2890944.1 zinc/manganese transport system ATP-binding protein [Nonomuraea soli]